MSEILNKWLPRRPPTTHESSGSEWHGDGLNSAQSKYSTLVPDPDRLLPTPTDDTFVSHEGERGYNSQGCLS